MIIEIKNDVDVALKIMGKTSVWMLKKQMNIVASWLEENINLDSIKDVFNASEDEFYVFYVDDKPAGACLFQIGDKLKIWEDGDKVSSTYLYKFCIAEDFRGKGYSGKFLDLLKEKTKELKLSCFRLDTDKRNIKLHAMYEKNGFAKVGELKDEDGEFVLYEYKV